jgi:hypothetical protein
MVSTQRMTNIKSGGTVEQRANVPVEQVMDQIDAAKDVRQLIDVASANLDLIAGQVSTLRTKLEEYDPKASVELGKLAAAETAARSGDSGNLLANLKGLARWVADFASKIGVSVVSKLIEHQIGLPSSN